MADSICDLQGVRVRLCKVAEMYSLQARVSEIASWPKATLLGPWRVCIPMDILYTVLC